MERSETISIRLLTARLLLGAAIVALSASCSPVPVPTRSAPIEDGTGMVMGRTIVIYQGQEVGLDNAGHLYTPTWDIEVSPYASDNKLDGAFISVGNKGKWSLSATPKDNHNFVASLPAGRYYFFAYGLVGVGHGPQSLISLKAYSTTGNDKFVTTFNVEAGKVTYIGTQKLTVNYDGLKVSVHLDVLNESTGAIAWLHDRYAMWPVANVDLARTHPIP